MPPQVPIFNEEHNVNNSLTFDYDKGEEEIRNSREDSIYNSYLNEIKHHELEKDKPIFDKVNKSNPTELVIPTEDMNPTLTQIEPV